MSESKFGRCLRENLQNVPPKCLSRMKNVSALSSNYSPREKPLWLLISLVNWFSSALYLNYLMTSHGFLNAFLCGFFYQLSVSASPRQFVHGFSSTNLTRQHHQMRRTPRCCCIHFRRFGAISEVCGHDPLLTKAPCSIIFHAWLPFLRIKLCLEGSSIIKLINIKLDYKPKLTLYEVGLKIF